MPDRPFTVIRGGAVLDRDAPRPRAADILIAGGVIREIGPPGLAAPEDAQEIPAPDRLLLPGLVNAHTHSHYTLAKGIAGNWTLEMLLNAGPWVTGGRAREDLRLGAMLGAAEMIRKGCTACYDMVLELPAPSPEGIGAVAAVYDEVGMRAVVAPALADRVFWAAVPGLIDAVPEKLRGGIERMRASSAQTTLAGARTVLHDWRFDRDRVRPTLAPAIPLLCSDAFLADVAAVESVMIAGRMVYDRRRFVTIDYERLVERANARAAELAEANAGLRREMDAVADVVGAFCVGLAREPYHVHRYVGARPGDACGDSHNGVA